MLQDLAVITGGQVVSEDLGLKLENVTEEYLGTCAKIKVILSLILIWQTAHCNLDSILK